MVQGGERGVYWYRLNKIRVWISNYMKFFTLEIITYTWPNINGGLNKPPLKLGYERITSIGLCERNYLSKP